ncbi:glycoside hydrolase family 17 protein [Methylobacter marinus]|uniref:glycoside hydrolase family 17 protein n=1 Tax=Methylobacter marinus TaxID=34058 RepID=UPI000685CDFB|nr:glycosyl hydrolase family 17 protein [Methylobacter marinus]
MKKSTVLMLVALTVALNGLFGWLNNRPVDVGPDVPDGKLTSLSFAPFRDGQSPIEKVLPTPAQIEEDISLLADKTRSIRTYSSLDGLQVVPGLARKYGLTMIQGAWLTYERPFDPATLSPEEVQELNKAKTLNHAEIKELIRSANANPDVVKRVMVGNEVLLRGEMEPEQLITYIREVKKAVKQPVSYADVWSFYLKYPEIGKEVDFITIHILPYWEDEPLEVNDAIAHIEKTYQQVYERVRALYPGKPILIGESGWPSDGRQRGWAVPSVANEARFIRGLIQVSRKNGFNLNIVEAFDQSWKSAQEGVVGANWGLLSADREPVFSLTGKVVENPDWTHRLIASTAILLLTVAFHFKALSRLPLPRLAVFLAFAQLLASLMVTLADELWTASFTPLQSAGTTAIIAVNALLTVCLAYRALTVLNNDTANKKLGAWLQTLYGILIALAVYKTYTLALDGRYISFPYETTYIAVTGMLGLVLMRYINERNGSVRLLDFNRLIDCRQGGQKRNKVIAYVLVIMSLALIIGETRAFLISRDFIEAHPDITERLKLAVIYTITNSQLLAWLASLGVLALPLWSSGYDKSPKNALFTHKSVEFKEQK